MPQTIQLTKSMKTGLQQDLSTDYNRNSQFMYLLYNEYKNNYMNNLTPIMRKHETT